ncbi:unnamed protein product, partial [Rotaria sp. Silwood2]
DFENDEYIPLIIAPSVAARDYVHHYGCIDRAGNIGYAYTFLTSKQEGYASHIIEPLKESGTPVPEELTFLWNDYVKKMKAMGKVIQISRGHFSGQHEDTDEASEDIHEKIQSLFKSKKLTRAKDDARIAENQDIVSNSIVIINDTALKSERAKKFATRLISNKSETRDSIRQVATSLFQHGV